MNIKISKSMIYGSITATIGSVLLLAAVYEQTLGLVLMPWLVLFFIKTCSEADI